MRPPLKPPVGWYRLRAESWRRQLEAGKTIHQIAAEYDVSPQSVRRVLDSLGLIKPEIGMKLPS